MKYLKYSIFTILVLALASCHKDDPGTIEETSKTNFTPTVELATTGDILGYVYNEENDPVVGASVSVLGNTTTTDQYGVFKFKNIELDQNGSYVKVEKPGYILGSDLLFAVGSTNNTSRIKLLRLDNTGTFSTSNGGTVNVEGGGQVTFAANSIEKDDGSSYSGSVLVTAKRIATDDGLLSDVMPGGLWALDSEGRTRVLGTMGMVAVELRDGSGNELNLKPGATADITFPIAANQQGGAPDEIELWSFDEERGIWVEEGKAVREGENYLGTVSHFSFWNCDAPFPVVGICGKVLYEDGTPASQIQLKVVSTVFGVTSGWTNADGSFSGKVPKNQILTLKIFNTLCGGDDAIIEIEFGPIANKTVLDDIIIPLPSSLTFEGVVLCSGSPVAGASVIYSFDGNSYVIESESDGSFAILINDECGNVEEISVFAVDPLTGMGSLTEILSPNTDPLIELEVCNDCDFTVTIETDNSVDPCEFRKIKAVVDGNGTYEYLWTGGSTDDFTEVSASGGQYCVTVTEVDLECSMVMCSDENGFLPLGGELSISSSCAGEDGTVWVWVNGGYPPYTFTWSDPSIMFDNPDSLVVQVPPGTYGLTVADAEGCTKTFEAVVESAPGFTVDINQNPDCYGSSLEAVVTGGAPDYQYFWDSNISGQGPFAYVSNNGEVCLTVIDANGCSATTCVEVNYVDIWSLVNVNVTDCEDGTYTFTNNSFDDILIEFWFAGNSITLPNNESVEIDLIPFGFSNTWVGAYSPTLGCDFEFEIQVPNLFRTNAASALYELTDRTCDTCDDAQITFTNEHLNNPPYIPQNGAIVNNILIIDADYNDVTAGANAGTLGAGIYFVVVTDQDTDCYIYSEKIVIE